MMNMHSLKDPKTLESTTEIHGVKMTYADAVAKGLALVNLDEAGVIQHIEVLNPQPPSFVSPDGELPGYEGTIVKQG